MVGVKCIWRGTLWWAVEGSVITAATAIFTLRGVLRAFCPPSALRDSTLSDPGLLTPGKLFLESALIPSSPEGLSSESLIHCPEWVFQGPPLKRLGEEGAVPTFTGGKLQPGRLGAQQGGRPCGPQPSLVSLTLGTTILSPAGWGVTRGGSFLVWGTWGGAAAPDALQWGGLRRL